LGDAGNKDMQRTVRVHANFAEYVPLGLLVGRLSHANGVSQSKENFRFRIVGMSLTLSLTALLACAVHLL
jgi:uncharacterized membrane protein YecN with MAPEG domain